jgi:hypothetical protein
VDHVLRRFPAGALLQAPEGKKAHEALTALQAEVRAYSQEPSAAAAVAGAAGATPDTANRWLEQLTHILHTMEQRQAGATPPKAAPPPTAHGDEGGAATMEMGAGGGEGGAMPVERPEAAVGGVERPEEADGDAVDRVETAAEAPAPTSEREETPGLVRSAVAAATPSSAGTAPSEEASVLVALLRSEVARLQRLQVRVSAAR